MVQNRQVLLSACILAVAIIVAGLLSTHSAGAASPQSQAQFFHAALVAQVLPDDGTTTILAQTFTITQSGAFDLTSLQDVSLFGLCCGSGPDVDTITATAYLDGAPLVSVSKTNPNGAAYPTSLDLTTTHTVLAGSHTLTLVYVTSTAPNPPNFPGEINAYSGTLSLAIVTQARSN